MKLKLADLCAENDVLEKAVEIYEEIAEPTRGSTNYSAPDYYWKALICRMVLETKTKADIKESSGHFERYKELCPMFNQGATRRQCELLTGLFDAFAKESIDDYEAALNKYQNSGGILKPFDIKMLLQVKTSITDPQIAAPVVGGGQPESGSEDDYA